jgi:ERp29, N-terminal domain
VKDYGEKDNEDIANRFGAKKEDFPGNPNANI